MNDAAPDPNADRDDDYPNRWRIERGKQTAKCMFCSRSLAGTKWCVTCENCNKRMCSLCWEGKRFNKYGEEIFEGRVQNEEGCWCRFSIKFDPAWQGASDARAARMEKLIAAEMEATRMQAAVVDSEDDTEIEQPVTKRVKVESLEPKEIASPGDNRYEESAVRFNEPSRARQKSPTVDSVQQHTPELSPKSNMRIHHLRNKTTVIIGAGVVGLAIARELAAATKTNHTNHEVIVVERRKSYSQGASQHCFGIIAEHGVLEGYEHLLALSLESWRALLDDEDNNYCKELQHQADGILHVERPSAQKENATTARAPAWYEARPQDVLNTYDSDIGKIATSKFVKFLYQQCREMDVKFRFRQEVANIEKTKNAKLMSLDIAKVGDPDRFVEVPCHNLIVAAGAHTLDALHELVPWIEPRTSLMNIKQHCDFTRVKGHTITDTENLGLVIHTPTSNDPVIVAGQSGEELKAASVRPRTQHVLFDDSEPEADHFSNAASVARDQLSNGVESTKLRNGVATISTAQDGLPMVCKIPSALIDDRFEGEDDNPLGFYIAYGFGMYGTTMSLGVATAIRAMMFGQDAGIGETFDYP
ncbi:hypothetical protein MBLNU13_g02146t1 [Cladosporium sp. NU13]